jgi:hypothetical protein
MFTFFPSLGHVPKEERETCYAARSVTEGGVQFRKESYREGEKSGGDSWNIKKCNSEIRNCRNFNGNLRYST